MPNLQMFTEKLCKSNANKKSIPKNQDALFMPVKTVSVYLAAFISSIALVI